MKEEKTKYKLILNANKYIIGFYNIVDGEEYDYEGQMADFPEVCEGWYKFQKGTFVIDEKRKQEVLAQRQAELDKPTWQETIEAQTFYTAMITDTLIDSKVV